MYIWVKWEKIKDGYVCTHTHAHTHIHVCVHTHTHLHTHTHTRTHAHTHTHTQGLRYESAVKLILPFCFILYFHEIDIGPFQGIESSKCLLVSQPWAVWHKARAWRDIMSSHCLPRSFLVSTCLYGSNNILNAHVNPCGHTSSLPPTHCTWTCLLLACHLCNLCCTFTGKHLHLVYFKKQLNFLFIFCSSLQLPSSMSPKQFMWHVKRDLQVNI